MGYLESQIISFPCRLGVDTKTAERLVDGSRFLSLQNTTFVEGEQGALHKRNGYDLLPTRDVNSNILSNGQALAIFSQGSAEELDSVCSGSLYALSPTANAWVNKGTVPTLGFTSRAVARNASGQANCDSVVVNGIGFYAWESLDGTGVYWVAIDESNGSLITVASSLSVTAGNPSLFPTQSPRVVTVGTNVVIFCANSGAGINAWKIPAASPWLGAGAGIVVTSSTDAGTAFDVQYPSSVLGLTFMDAGQVVFAKVNTSTLVVSSSTAETVTPVPECLSLVQLGNANFCVFGGADTGLSATFFSGTSTAFISNYTLISGSNFDVVQVTGIAQATSQAVVFAEIGPLLPTDDRYITQVTVDQSLGMLSGANVARGVSLASQLFKQGLDYYVLAVFPSAVQQTLFLLNSEGQVQAKLFPLNAGAAPTHPRLPTVNTTSSGHYSISTPIQAELTSVNAKPVSIAGIQELLLDFTASNVTARQLGESLTLTGSLTSSYDGATITELGFNNYPEAPTLTVLSTNIGIVTTVDGNTAAQQVTITFPSVSTHSSTVTDGSLITPGEYVMFASNIGGLNQPGLSSGSLAFYVWFSVDDVGSDPVLPGHWTAVECPISSKDSGPTIALKFWQALIDDTNPVVAAGYTMPTKPLAGTAQFTLTYGSGTFISRPSTNRCFNICQTWDGSTGTGPTGIGVCTLNSCPGNLIDGGQYFNFLATASGSDNTYYVWFSVDGVGTDPAPNPFWIGVNVAVTSNDSENTVATKIKAALLVSPGPSVVNPEVEGPTITIVNQQTLASAPIASTDFATNPYNGGVGWGYLGGGVNDYQEQAYEFTALYEAFNKGGELSQSSAGVTNNSTAWIVTFLEPLFSGTTLPGRGKVSVSVPTLRLTERTGVDIAIFSTLANGSTFYRVTSPIDVIPNSTTTDSITYVDGTPDTTLSGNAVLYTDGGIAANDGPPASTVSVIHQNRLWLNDSDNPLLCWYSQPFVAGQGVAFNAAQTFQLDPQGGPIVAFGSMDSTLVIFTQSRIYGIVGFGPDAAGNGQAFSGPTLFSTTVGCRDPGSVCLTSKGLVFKSYNGLQLLDRSGQVSYIGLPVESFNADIITNALCINESTQMRLLSEDGTSQLYDYGYGQWGQSTSQGVAAVLYNGVYTYLLANGNVYSEDSSTFADAGTVSALSVETAWLRLGAIQGYQQVWNIFLLGTFPGTFPIQIQVCYDYVDTVAETFVWNEGAGGNGSFWGSDAFWGGSPDLYWGGDTPATYPDQIQLQYFPLQQQCQALKLIITELSPFSSTKALALDSIDLEVGIQKGGPLLPTTQRIN